MRVRVKICGITTPEDAQSAAMLGADAIGLNFYAKSPRCIDAATARAIVSVLPVFVEPVALFVNEPHVVVQSRCAELGVRTSQIHGEQTSPVPIDHLRWIPAFAVKDADSLIRISSYVESCRTAGTLPAAILVDAHVPGMYGGTGRAAPWHLLADFKPGVPMILAGGLTPDNVAEAVRVVRPWAVDVASGVEASPGRKDAELVRRFIEAVREGE
ncbi:MAG: phosphoribosylanthranilate isomerase [Gemmataceae bacterium]|nr:phosphoribosylanthranilate isomerase [Gemmataceae bacterium]